MESMVFFDLNDPFAECRLSDVQPFGSPSEIHLLGEDKDCLQVTYFDHGEHCSTPFTRGGDRQPPTSSKGTSTREKAAKQSRDARRKENCAV
jgi:hypothetical protein